MNNSFVPFYQILSGGHVVFLTKVIHFCSDGKDYTEITNPVIYHSEKP